jgi:arylsulfatase A
MKTSLEILPLLLLAVAFACDSKNTIEQKPNIIYILADDMGYADLGCYGAKRIQTPNIDKLASEGILFTNHYAGNTVCAPSRCSLITGLTTGHCQVRGNKQWEPYGQIPLKENTVTVATELKKAGYKTALIGKWGLGVEGTSGDPLNQGFDYSYGYLCQVLAHNHCPEFLMENGEKVFLNNKVVYMDTAHWTKGLGSYPVEKNQFSQELFTQKAIDFIEQNQKNPFFLYFPVIIPHDNSEAPDGKRYSDIPSFEPYVNNDWTESEKGYAAMITYLDNEVGKIMDKLSELGLDENTLVIFTSDNGGDSPDSFHLESNAPFRGAKRDLYEGGIRVPFIARWTGQIEAGRKSGHISAFWDFLPTACELANTEIPSETDGISYLPELLGKQQKEHESLYFEFHELGGKQAIIEGDWKLIRLNVNDSLRTITELYNLKNDSSEQENLAETQIHKVTDLTEMMKLKRTKNENFYFEFEKNPN